MFRKRSTSSFLPLAISLNLHERFSYDRILQQNLKGHSNGVEKLRSWLTCLSSKCINYSLSQADASRLTHYYLRQLSINWDQSFIFINYCWMEWQINITLNTFPDLKKFSTRQSREREVEREWVFLSLICRRMSSEMCFGDNDEFKPPVARIHLLFRRWVITWRCGRNNATNLNNFSLSHACTSGESMSLNDFLFESLKNYFF